jgi:ribonuclease BN (tRNA processing enzyme)
MGKDHILPLLALLMLFTATTASLYVYATETTTDTIRVNNQEYTIDQLFSFTASRSFPELNYSGIALDDLMIKTGVTAPDQHTYTFRGADGYEKTVTWENMKNGLLTNNQASVFSDLPKAFRVKDIITIEVK